MTIDEFQNLLEQTSSCHAWSLQLLQITPDEKQKAIYASRKTELKPDGSLTELVQEIRARYVLGKRPAINAFESVEKYDGTGSSGVIYCLSKDNPLIQTQFQNLIMSISSPETEAGLQKFESIASMIKGTVGGKCLLLFSMKSPFVTLRHRFLANSGVFKKITDRVLSLRTMLDVIIFDDNVYLLTSEGEKLFLMEQAYKAAVPKKAELIASAGIVTDGEALAHYAAKGFNPRRLISINQNRLDDLRNPSIRKEMSEKFSIPLVDGRFDTSSQDAADSLIKLLCNKGMVDPFDGKAMEVAGAKLWKK